MSLEGRENIRQESKNHFQSCMFQCAVAPQAIILVKVQLYCMWCHCKTLKRKTLVNFRQCAALYIHADAQTHFTSLIDYPSLCYSVSVLHPECVY